MCNIIMPRYDVFDKYQFTQIKLLKDINNSNRCSLQAGEFIIKQNFPLFRAGQASRLALFFLFLLNFHSHLNNNVKAKGAFGFAASWGNQPVNVLRTQSPTSQYLKSCP